MFMPTLSGPGTHRRIGIAGLSALLLGTSTSVVMAANPGCQVAMHFETMRAKTAVTRRVHHSAATLARWKVGAAAWSQAHHGKVYAGHPAAQVAIVWRPLTYTCDDIALETSMGTPMLTGEALPELEAFASGAPPIGEPGSGVVLLPSDVPTDQDDFYAGLSVVPSMGTGPIGGAGAPPIGNVSPASLPAVTAPRSPRLLPPKHPPQEVTLLPVPLPSPVVVPTPEPSAILLLGTGLATLGLSGLRRRMGC